MRFPKLNEEFEDIKGVIRIRIYIEEEQTTQWPKEKVQRDKQRQLGSEFFLAKRCSSWWAFYSSRLTRLTRRVLLVEHIALPSVT
jgi:hypothetical protein